jgi:transglutaminase-like putative cysteine protease
MNLRALVLALVLVIAAINYEDGLAQKWGEVSSEETAMTYLPEEPEADAAVLFDKGRYSFPSYEEVLLNRHTRVKIFTARGVEFAKISIPFAHGDKIKGLEGQVYCRSGNKFKLDKSQVFTKKGTNWDEIIFTLPGVEEGCIFEYRYQRWSTNRYYLGNWNFQNDLFTRLSEVMLELLPLMTYSYYFLPPEAGTKPDTSKKDIFSWTFKNIPAMKKEPYIACVDDHRLGVYLEAVPYREIDSYHPEAIDTWQEIGEMVSVWYEPYLKAIPLVQDKCVELTKSVSSDSAKAAKIYDYVCNEIQWDEQRGAFDLDKRDLEPVLKRKQGNGAEKNLLLLSLLKAAGIEAYPLLIGTRDYCNVLPRPSLIPFNHLIGYVEIAGKELLVDAVEKSFPFGVLPPDDLVISGLLLSQGTSRLMDIRASRIESQEHFVTEGELLPDGTLRCSSKAAYLGYCNASTRRKILDLGKEDFLKNDLMQQISTPSLDTVVYVSLDSVRLPLEINIGWSASNHAQIVGDNIYINPTFFLRLESNPFKNETRAFPVDFAYPYSEIEDTKLEIPEGFELDPLPAAVYREIPGAKFSKGFTSEGKVIRCFRRLTITQLVFPVSQYQKLRNFFQDVANADQLMVVLKKNQN